MANAGTTFDCFLDRPAPIAQFLGVPRDIAGAESSVKVAFMEPSPSP